jgi:hypothetical protein
MAAGTCAWARRGEGQAWLLAAVLVAKLGYEQLAGPMPFSGGPVVVDAHLYGVLGGAAVALTMKPAQPA